MSDRKGTRNYQRNFVTKRRRRREGKTDYNHRTNLLRQSNTEYSNVKSRLVVRKTGSKIICSIIKAFIEGDRVVATADSTELKNYGINFGLTNSFAAYATGFLCARKALSNNGLDKIYQPNMDCGEYKVTEDVDEDHKAYKAYLDLGLSRATNGAKVFTAMKGASDAGLQIPHSETKFYGYSKENGLNSEELRNRIFMKSNIDYMINLRSTDEDSYKRQFGQYIALNIQPENISSLYENCLNMISSKLVETPKKAKRNTHYRGKITKLTAEERKIRAQEKLISAGNQE